MAMIKFNKPRRREGYEFRRVLVARSDFAQFVPEDGWQVESYGQPIEQPGQQVALTLRRPLPPLPRPGNILDIACEFLRSSGQCTLTLMARRLGLGEGELREMLCAAGVPAPGSARPWLRNGDQLIWFDNRKAATQGIKLRTKRIEPEEEYPPEDDYS